MERQTQTTRPPGIQIPDVVRQEIETFREELARWKRGEIHDEKFKRFRLQHGIYGQRQKDYFMVRVKIPNGRLTSLQLHRLGEIAATYARGIGHITTRQDIQFHFVEHLRVPEMMERLAEVGLTTREACGNTVRNITACPLAGICPEELVDVTPLATASTYYLLRNPLCQSLPRKFKIGFSGCGQDCAMAPIQDIGLIAVTREGGGVGFRVLLGGGLGPHPRSAQEFDPCLPPEDLPLLFEAVLRIFDQHGERRNRAKARMKFLIERWGWDRFARTVREEMEALRKTRSQEARFQVPEPNGHPGTGRRVLAPPEGGSKALRHWWETNVLPQKQEGYAVVSVRVPLGDLTADQMHALADLAQEVGRGELRTTQQQNILIYWVPEDQVETVYPRLLDLGLAHADAGRLVDIQSCPGAETCNLGLTASRQLASAIADQLVMEGLEGLEGVRIKVSGCPNSCGHHHVADLGFHGVARKVDGHLSPHYQLHLGGGIRDSRAWFGESRIKIPARLLPAAVAALVRRYREERTPGEPFWAYAERVGLEALQETLAPFLELPDYETQPACYRDWGAEEDFSLDELGPGECSGGVIDLMEECLLAARRELDQARVLLERGEAQKVGDHVDQAVVRMASGMLVPFGVDTEVRSELLLEFQNKIIDKCVIPDRAESLIPLVGQPVESEAAARHRLELAQMLLEDCEAAYQRLDANLKFQTQEASQETEKKEEASMTTQPKADAILDLKGVACPYNFVKTKLQLEEMESGQILEIIIDEGEPYQNVPRSVKAEGHTILLEEKISDKHYRILIQKA